VKGLNYDMEDLNDNNTVRSSEMDEFGDT